jgi:hypothetical protein
LVFYLIPINLYYYSQLIVRVTKVVIVIFIVNFGHMDGWFLTI